MGGVVYCPLTVTVTLTGLDTVIGLVWQTTLKQRLEIVITTSLTYAHMTVDNYTTPLKELSTNFYQNFINSS